MSFACECDIDGSGDWYYKHRGDFTCHRRDRRKRCVSCGTLIPGYADAGEFERYRAVRNDIEYRINGYDEEWQLASWWMCEECYGVVLSVEEQGGCLFLERGEDVRESVRDFTGCA